jgi:hypothetical protein
MPATVPPPDQAFDLLIRPRGPNLTTDGGWVFGVPRGITPDQWPMDPNSGFPLMHGFTLRLPPAYRCHGPEITGLSFFAIAPDHNDGGPVCNEAARAAFDAIEAAHTAPQRNLYRMRDILGGEYAVLLLTEDQIRGAACGPPPPLVASDDAPAWLTTGSAHAIYKSHAPFGGASGVQPLVHRVLGEEPPLDIAWSRAIELTPRAQDPNAGKAPVETSQETPGGYQSMYRFETDASGKLTAVEHAWAKGHELNHLGGTMRQVQGVPPGFSPFYLGFEEYFGGYNFGGGAAQLDFLNMLFDWAC